MHEQETER